MKTTMLRRIPSGAEIPHVLEVQLNAIGQQHGVRVTVTDGTGISRAWDICVHDNSESPAANAVRRELSRLGYQHILEKVVNENGKE